MDKHSFPVIFKLRIDWSELDLFGHVNNVMFVKYVQAGRVNYWEQIGLYQEFLKTKKGPMLVSVKCDFRKPLLFPGHVTINTRMEFIGNTSFGFHHLLLDDNGDEVAEAHDVMVSFDFNRNQKMPFPAELRKAVEKLENRTF
jgi:acyl-CoA thioester hydrolase